ncbi:MAG: hypothetical protein ACKV19_11565 [Verrucomicrobiales bacterium]
MPVPTYQLFFFVLGLICAVPFLIWYYRRNPHPRFRPRLGEMAMVSLFAVMLSLGGSMLVGGVMDDPEQFNTNGAFSTMPPEPGSQQSEESSNDNDSRSGSSRGQGSGSGKSERR